MNPITRSRRTTLVIRWLAVALALVSLWFAIWILLPAPTYALLTYSVGGPEVSPWLIVLSLAGIALATSDARASRVARAALSACLITLCIDALPLVALRFAIRAADAETAALRVEPASPARASRFSIWDAFRGIPIGRSIVTRGVLVPIDSGSRLAMDVYRATQHGPHPIVVQIYGGAWQRGSPESNANFARWLAATGYVVFAIDYRHAPRWHWPAQLHDVDSALAFIAHHAAEYDGDTSRVVLVGRSSGAHLALMAAYRDAPIHIRGVVDFYGPADLVTPYRDPPNPDPIHVRATESALIGGPLDAMLPRYAEASPLTYATHPLPATLLIYGGRDHIVEPKYGRALAARLMLNGTRAAYIEIPWADHAFDEVFRGPGSQLALYYVERFIAAANK